MNGLGRRIMHYIPVKNVLEQNGVSRQEFAIGYTPQWYVLYLLTDPWFGGKQLIKDTLGTN